MHLLLIEDDPTLSQILSRDLKEKGHSVECALDGEEGLYQATNWPYDIIILDVMLPKLDGWSMLRKLRQTHQTPVLMLTAKDTVENRVLGLDLGADDYLTKPFHFDELIARISAIMRRSYGINGAVMEAQNVKLNIDSKTVYLEEEAVDVTTREFKILEILMARKGKVVTHDILRDFLSDSSDEVASGTIDVHIHNLRKKFGKSLIRTLRGLGYTIDV